MRFLYTSLMFLAAPVVFLGLLWRGFKDRGYWDRPLQRFGYGPVGEGATLWVHAVSVGEVRAAAILIPRLKASWPDLPIVVTTTTPTGARQVKDLFADTVSHRYLPFDLPGAVRRFVTRVRPRIGIVMETELWPNLYRECARHDVPLVIASARLSERSVRRYRPLLGLLRDALAHDVVVAAQSVVDAQRYVAIGADPARTPVTGNIKFDLAVPDAVRARGQQLRQMLGDRPVWVAGSTRDGEETILLDAHAEVRKSHPAALLVLVPRHPQRFAEVRSLLEARKIGYVSRSSGAAVRPETVVLLVDSLGELLSFYAAADIAFVGGTLVPVGGHNLLEPAALGLPILTGPHVFNAPEVAQLLLDARAAIEVGNAVEVAEAVCSLLDDPMKRQRRGEAGLRVVEENRGAVDRVVKLVAAAMGRRGGLNPSTSR